MYSLVLFSCYFPQNKQEGKGIKHLIRLLGKQCIQPAVALNFWAYWWSLGACLHTPVLALIFHLWYVIILVLHCSRKSFEHYKHDISRNSNYVYFKILFEEFCAQNITCLLTRSKGYTAVNIYCLVFNIYCLSDWKSCRKVPDSVSCWPIGICAYCIFLYLKQIWT